MCTRMGPELALTAALRTSETFLPALAAAADWLAEGVRGRGNVSIYDLVRALLDKEGYTERDEERSYDRSDTHDVFAFLDDERERLGCEPVDPTSWQWEEDVADAEDVYEDSRGKRRRAREARKRTRASSQESEERPRTRARTTARAMEVEDLDEESGDESQGASPEARSERRSTAQAEASALSPPPRGSYDGAPPFGGPNAWYGSLQGGSGSEGALAEALLHMSASWQAQNESTRLFNQALVDTLVVKGPKANPQAARAKRKKEIRSGSFQKLDAEKIRALPRRKEFNALRAVLDPILKALDEARSVEDWEKAAWACAARGAARLTILYTTGAHGEEWSEALRGGEEFACVEGESFDRTALGEDAIPEAMTGLEAVAQSARSWRGQREKRRRDERSNKTPPHKRRRFSDQGGRDTYFRRRGQRGRDRGPFRGLPRGYAARGRGRGALPHGFPAGRAPQRAERKLPGRQTGASN